MSRRRAILSGFGLVVALLLTLMPKIWIESHSAQVDVGRLNADVAARLRTLGLHAAVVPWAPDPIVEARSDHCDVIVRNGDRARELASLFRLEMTRLGPVEIGYRGVWTPRPAGSRSVLERLAQDAAMRVGVRFDRPAVLAMAHSGGCPDLKGALRGLATHSMLRQPRPPIEAD